MKRILFISFGSIGSTLALRATHLAAEMTKIGWDCHIAARSSGSIEVSPVTLHTVSSGIVPAVWNCRKLISDLRPEHVHFLNPGPLAYAILAGLAKISVVGDWEDWHTNDAEPSIKNPIHKFADRRMLRRSNIVLTASKWLKEEFARLFKIRAHYIPYAIDQEPFSPQGNPYEEKTAVFMGNLHPWWEHRMLLDAVKSLQERGTDALPAVEFIGKGQDLEYCRGFARDNDLRSVNFTGFMSTNEMQNRLHWAHVLLFPFSGKVLNLARCPLKVFHYAKAKRPIITSRFGEVAEFLGDKPIYVGYEKTEYADALLTAMQLPRVESVDYGIEQQTWCDRARQLDAILSQ